MAEGKDEERVTLTIRLIRSFEYRNIKVSLTMHVYDSLACGILNSTLAKSVVFNYNGKDTLDHSLLRLILMHIKVLPSRGREGVSSICAVSRAATTVKMQSKGQGTSWGSVKPYGQTIKWCSGPYPQHS